MSAGQPWRRGPRPDGVLWGWNQLDLHAARRVVAAAELDPGDLVVDLGAGTGALTEALLANGARVIAVELHRGRADVLRRRFSGRPVIVRQGDLRTLRYPAEPFRVVANPPWSIADTIRARLLRERRLRRADLLVPRWLACRWAAADPRIVVGLRVRAEAFRPAAPSAAAIAVLHPRARR